MTSISASKIDRSAIAPLSPPWPSKSANPIDNNLTVQPRVVEGEA
jgi:hypothetical protein